MKFSKTFATLAVAALAVASASAYTVSVARYPQYNAGVGGGEFSITSPDLPVGSYSAKALASYLPTAHAGFQTFCIEHGEDFFGATVAVLNTEAVNGGVGGPHPDPISRATAWLYSQFALGILAGYDYDNTGVGRTTSAKALQEALWYLENESAFMGTGAGYVALAQGISNWSADANGDFGVLVMNLYKGDGTLRQDMLIYVPDGGATLMLLGSSLVGLAVVRRKQLC